MELFHLVDRHLDVELPDESFVDNVSDGADLRGMASVDMVDTGSARFNGGRFMTYSAMAYDGSVANPTDLEEL